MLTLGIDTSNYATSLALFDTDTNAVVCDVKQFLPVKIGELGLRQSDALFHHTVALPLLLEKLNSNHLLTKVKAVCVSQKPRPEDGSYMPCFLAGLTFAEGIAAALGVKLIKKSHQEGHICAAIYATNNDNLYTKKHLAFHISGGTTEMLLCNG
ncbi:MAG: glycoprotease, partial [Oscillospiraceae bacterium]